MNGSKQTKPASLGQRPGEDPSGWHQGGSRSPSGMGQGCWAASGLGQAPGHPHPGCTSAPPSTGTGGATPPHDGRSLRAQVCNMNNRQQGKINLANRSAPERSKKTKH